MKMYQRPDQTIIVCTYSNTLRLMPENYLIASHKGSHWQLDPDLACPLQTVLLVSAALMQHEIKWSKIDDCKLLAAVTGENVRNYLEDSSSMVYIDQVAKVTHNLKHI